MIFAIHAYETNYSGLNGIEDWAFDEADNENADSLHDYGRQLSMGVIESYNFLQEEYVDNEEDFDSMSEYELNDIINEHLAWKIIPLPSAPSMEACWEYMNKHNNPEGLIEMYGA